MLKNKDEKNPHKIIKVNEINLKLQKCEYIFPRYMRYSSKMTRQNKKANTEQRKGGNLFLYLRAKQLKAQVNKRFGNLIPKTINSIKYNNNININITNISKNDSFPLINTFRSLKNCKMRQNSFVNLKESIKKSPIKKEEESIKSLKRFNKTETRFYKSDHKIFNLIDKNKSNNLINDNANNITTNTNTNVTYRIINKIKAMNNDLNIKNNLQNKHGHSVVKYDNNNKNNEHDFPFNMINSINEYKPYTKIKKLFNTFEEIKKKYFILTQQSLPLLLNIPTTTPQFNYYVNFTYRRQIPLYMKHRINWKLVTDKNEGYSLRFKYYPGRVNYKYYQYNTNTPMEKLRMINIFEKYRNIGNKEKFFLNFIKYCNDYHLNPFEYIPFTVILTKGQSFLRTIKSLENLIQKCALTAINLDSITNTAHSSNNNLIENKSINDFDKNSYNSQFPLPYTQLTSSNKSLINIPIFIPNSFQSPNNLWIIKPPNLLQGIGIKVVKDIDTLKEHCNKLITGIDQLTAEREAFFVKKGLEPIPKKYKTTNIIIQKYLDCPLLYKNRKFDIRCYVLLDFNLNVFICREGHLKACSQPYDLSTLDIFKHITNYSLQKKCKDFGKFEEGNEISFKSFIECLNENIMRENNKNEKNDNNSSIKNMKEIRKWRNDGKEIFKKIFNDIKKLVQISMNAIGKKVFGLNNVLSFQIFGYDFIIDKNYRPWILEINDNPGIEISSKLISKLIPRMFDDAMRLTVDKVFSTVYDSNVIDKNTGKYKSPFDLDGFNSEENVFEFLCNVNYNKTFE